MSAERSKNQLDCETRCRLRVPIGLWPSLLLLLLWGICLRGTCGTGADEASGWATPWPDTTLDDCHVEYMLASANASSTYARDYELCELTANETKLDLTIDEQLEREQNELGQLTLCGNFEQCGMLEDDLLYIECINNHGSQNLQLITEIKNNASSAYTRLRQDYDTVQQTLALCTLEAQVAYMSRVREAHEELQQCRREVDNFSE